ncbi:hypothetical protein CLOP_g1939 [Closterium sp. NIES-67]|nr:hypothetical protein CLOP_g1939 [Closterium sp. NIES-67]
MKLEDGKVIKGGTRMDGGPAWGRAGVTAGKPLIGEYLEACISRVGGFLAAISGLGTKSDEVRARRKCAGGGCKNPGDDICGGDMEGKDLGVGNFVNSICFCEAIHQAPVKEGGVDTSEVSGTGAGVECDGVKLAVEGMEGGEVLAIIGRLELGPEGPGGGRVQHTFEGVGEAGEDDAECLHIRSAPCLTAGIEGSNSCGVSDHSICVLLNKG